eukprot:s2417_g14.t3
MLVTSHGMSGIGYPLRRIGWADCIVPHPDKDGELLHARGFSSRFAKPRQRNSRSRRRRPLWDAAEALGLSGLLRRTGRLVRPWRKRGAKWKQHVAPVVARNWQEWGAPRWTREALGLLLRRPWFPQVLSTKSRAEALSLLFLFVAKGSPNRDQINAPHRKRRDSVARCLSGAIWRAPGTPYQDRAAALLFEDGRSWLLDSDVIVSSVGTLPSESSLLRHVWKAGKSNSGGVREMVPPRSDALEASAYRLLRSLGSPAGSALILLDDQHPPLPLVEHAPSRIRRALFLLGCPAGLSPSQEHAFARAAHCAGWQVLRLRLGKASEFASKMVLRLQVWHSCGRLLPSLDAMAPGGGFLPWPSQRNLSKDYDSGALTKVAVHFLVPIETELSELFDPTGPCSSAARDALALATRSAVAAVCHSKGGWRGCQITLCFRCGGMITIHGRLADRLVHTSRAFSELVFLKELKKSGLKQQEEASSGIKVHRGQKISCGGALVLDLAANGSSRGPAPKKDSALNRHPAEKLRAALDQRPESFFVDLGTKKVTAAPHHVVAALRGCERANAPEVIGILQSALLGEESSSMEILRTVGVDSSAWATREISFLDLLSDDNAQEFLNLAQRSTKHATSGKQVASLGLENGWVFLTPDSVGQSGSAGATFLAASKTRRATGIQPCDAGLSVDRAVAGPSPSEELEHPTQRAALGSYEVGPVVRDNLHTAFSDSKLLMASVLRDKHQGREASALDTQGILDYLSDSTRLRAKASFLSLVDRCTTSLLGQRLLGAELEALSDAHRALLLRQESETDIDMFQQEVAMRACKSSAQYRLPTRRRFAAS